MAVADASKDHVTIGGSEPACRAGRLSDAVGQYLLSVMLSIQPGTIRTRQSRLQHRSPVPPMKCGRGVLMPILPCTPGKCVYVKAYREFESHPIR